MSEKDKKLIHHNIFGHRTCGHIKDVQTVCDDAIAKHTESKINVLFANIPSFERYSARDYISDVRTVCTSMQLPISQKVSVNMVLYMEPLRYYGLGTH